MTFGESAENYHKARYGYPTEVFSAIIDAVGSTHDKALLDIGCGTGIATVELQKFNFSKVVGCDYDQKMIDKALSNTASRIDYVVSPINSMPFKDNDFNVVTSFGSFHWFCDTASVDEIKRVLQQKGIFLLSIKTMFLNSEMM